MAIAELSVGFSHRNTVNVSFNDTDSGALEFSSPLSEKDRSDIRWYVETYAAASLADPRLHCRPAKPTRTRHRRMWPDRHERDRRSRSQPADSRRVNAEPPRSQLIVPLGSAAHLAYGMAGDPERRRVGPDPAPLPPARSAARAAKDTAASDTRYSARADPEA